MAFVPNEGKILYEQKYKEIKNNTVVIKTPLILKPVGFTLLNYKTKILLESRIMSTPLGNMSFLRTINGW